MTQRKKLSPRGASQFRDICRLQRDGCDTKNAWILVDAGKVHIHNQKTGEASTGEVTLSRRDFNRFVDWYNREQDTTGRAR